MNRDYHSIFIPALAYPVRVLITSMPAVTSDEKTNNKRVSAVTGIVNPVVIPLLISPIPINPVKGGVSVTTAPGTAVKLLSGVVD